MPPVDPEVVAKEKEALNDFFKQMDTGDSERPKSNRNEIFEESPQGEKKPAAMDATRKRAMAENEKNKGNECMKAKEYQDAVEHYKKAVSLDPSHHLVLGNLAQAYLNLKSSL